MKILSLDSSSPVASVALVETGTAPGTGGILFHWEKPHKRSDSSALFAGLREAVKAGGRPDRLCVGLGPGSYNGLRAGIATAQGFATALGLPLTALPSPLALPGPDSGFHAVGDARGGHYWIATVKGGAFMAEPKLLTPSEAATYLETLPELPVLGSAPLKEIERIIIATPEAARLAKLSEKTEPCDGTPEPLYLKPPHITMPKSSPHPAA